MRLVLKPITPTDTPPRCIELYTKTDGQIYFRNSSGVETGPLVPAMPSGTTVPYAGITAPSGWLLCYGQAVSRSTYSDLFSAIGTTYGSGDGSTTFNIPDMRGRAAIGRDDMGGAAASRITTGGSGINGATLGASGGAETHTLTTAQLASHSHGVTDPTHRHTRGIFSNAVANLTAGSSPYAIGDSTTNTDYAATGISIQSAGSGSAHQNTQPSLILNYIIKT